jgi:hypothetical protein
VLFVHGFDEVLVGVVVGVEVDEIGLYFIDVHLLVPPFTLVVGVLSVESAQYVHLLLLL